MSPSEFWQACQRALPEDTAGKPFRVRRFGDDPVMSKKLLELVKMREKTGTFAVDWEFEARSSERPRVGDLLVVTDAAGEPGALIRITAIELLPFSAVGDEHVQCEGPGLRDLALWRKVHWNYWTGKLQALGREPAADMPIVYQRFELLK